MLSNTKLTDVESSLADSDKGLNGDHDASVMESKSSQTLIFSSKESRSRYRRDYGPQTTRANQQFPEKRGIISGRNRTQITKRSSDYNDCKDSSSYFYNTFSKFSSNDWLNITSISGKNLDAAALQMNLPEDMRISKLLRRLCGEKNPNSAISICEKLKIVIVDPCNSVYIRRSFDILADSLITVLKEGPEECLSEVSLVFGMMGYVVRNEFSVYKSWIVKTYKNHYLRIPMMDALLHTLKMDKINRDLVDQSTRLMELLKDYLENAEIANLFISITNVIKQFSINYPKAFEPHFTDIVDIVVGWHLETDQSAALKQHCSALLQAFNRFWMIDMEFTINLLGQFLEDIVVCGDEITAISGRLSPILDKTAPPELCFASLVGAYNSVLKCSWETQESLVNATGNSLLTDSFEKITEVSQLTLLICHDEDIVLAINEFLAIILDCYPFNIELPFDNLFSLLRLQLKQIILYTDNQILSVLYVILKILIELKTAIPFELISDLFSQNSNLGSLKFVKSKRIYTALINIYHEVLNIKNVLLLQEAYKYILIDLGKAIKSLPGTKDIQYFQQTNDCTDIYSIEQAECAITFNLTSLSALAISNSSIIAMWALQPNILELLTNKLQTANYKIWINHTALHFAILNLLVSHCKKNNNFISSSSLMNSASTKISDVFNKLSIESTASSPTSQHFTLILEFLLKILSHDIGTKQMELTLNWCNQLIQQTVPYSEILKLEENFTGIIQRIATISIKSEILITLKCADCIDSLYDFKTLNHDIFTALAEVCCVHMCSNDVKVRSRYSNIFAKLPLDISLKQVNEYTGLAKERAKLISHFQHWHTSRTTHGDMRSQYFQNFIQSISFNSDAKPVDKTLKDIFINCWYEEQGAPLDFCKMALNDVRCLVSWAQWEAAQYCVNNKLRTTLGKPQDTFLKIESIIKEDARILALKEKSAVKSVDSLISNQKHTRILLGFMEVLEKAIYNASEGTAFALPPPEKPAKTFFHINVSTCNEWFNRIRTAVDLVALHCMEPEMVIRYCEVVLKNLAFSGKTNEPLFEHTLMSYAWALLRNGESDALYGLYVWTKLVTNRKFVWVKLAAEQAAGHRESAAIGYKAILDSSDEPKLDRHIRDFIADQLSLCYFFQHQWSDMQTFLIDEENMSIPRVTIPLISMTSTQLETTIQYFKTQDKTVFNLGNWELLENGPDVPNDFSYHKLLSLSENTIFNAGISSTPFDVNMFETCFSVVQNGLQECLRTKSREHLNNLTILNHICYKVAQIKIGTKKTDTKSLYIDKMFGSVTLMRLLWWSEFLSDETKEGEQVNVDLRLAVCSMARKEGNLAFCKNELEKFFDKNGLASKLGLNSQFTMEEICEQFLQPSVSLDINLWNENMARGVYETAKWMYCFPEKKDIAIQFAASTAIGICLKIAAGTSTDSPCIREKVARSLLTLSEWVQGENEKLLINNITSPLTRLITSLPDVKHNHESTSTSLVPLVDTAVGKLIQYSIKQCPDLAKAWAALGSWCYRWGRKMVEQRVERGDKAGLRHSDITAIANLISNASQDDITSIVNILNKHHVSPDDEEIGMSDACSTELMESQLRSVPILFDLSQDHLQSILDIWRLAHKSVYSYYEMSADAYFKYLQLATNSVYVEEHDNNGDCAIVTATLRLLRLIVKHALGLQEVLDEGLATTPTSPWKVIIPQLFSRLNHHEPYVRKRVSELLCRVARDSPHLIIFPTVVGSDQERCMDIADISMVSEDLDNEDDIKNYSNSGLTSCFNSLLDILSKQAQETVQQVQLLVRELKRVTLLWDELWLFTLAQVYGECAKRLLNFENEVNKSTDEEKNNLFIEKHRILMRPVIFVMERLYAMTTVKAETNNEQIFQEKYLNIIVDSIATLKKPFDREHPNEAWHKFKSLYGFIQQRAQKRSACSLKMVDISPVLAQMKNTAISMPGVDTANKNQLIYIKFVDNIVHILPTKTKPKKLAFHGSDGKRYTYLFKGLEDLHLDERIMQFLSIANSMMSKSIDCNGFTSKYRARHYSVIPLGPRSGLISWVDGVTPIFAFYKKWQQREASNLKKDKPDTTTRPSEMFFTKLNPLLAEHNLKRSDNRKDWPLAVLKQVLSELSSETPSDLLSKELWCYSTNAAAWRQVVRNYSQSIAVMSVIGYVIGLGDRHLDNILIELTSGEVVHIDYNVCFEKGKTLRVPEKVPFRMTPNLEEALGVTGIEGTFRLACEHVLKALKKGRETLLTLLEAFVYDPLVDWAVGEDGAGALAVSAYGGEALGGELRQARKQLEHEVTRDTLAIRFTEIKPDWIQNRDDVCEQLSDMRHHLQLLQQQRKDMQLMESNRDLRSNQLAMIREAESLGSAIGSHQLNTLSQRFSVYKRTKNEYEATKQALLEKSEDCYKQIQTYNECVKSSENNEFIQYLLEQEELINTVTPSEFEIVKEFLENSAQGAMYLQSDQIRKELDSSILQQAAIVKQAFESIIQYGNIVSFHPQSYVDQHRNAKYAEWCKFLSENQAVSACREVVTQFKTCLGENSAKPPPQQIMTFSYQLQAVLRDDNFKLQKNCEKLQEEFNTSDLRLIRLERAYEGSKSSIALFLQEENGAVKALECVALTALCDLNKRLLMMENAAASSGDNLLDLTLNGKWFLDELNLITAILSEIINIVYTNDSFDQNFVSAVNSFRSSNNVYSCLRDMHSTFINTILSQTLHGIISEDKSILDMISEISSLQEGLQPIQELLTNLHLHLRCSVMNMTSPHTASKTEARELREKLYQMKLQFESNDNTSAGSTLFLTINALFENLEEQHAKMVKAITRLNFPTEWKKIDQIKESKDLAALIFNSTTRSIFEDIYVVKRLEAMIEIFTLCLQLACSFKGNGICPVYDNERLARPLKKFIADYIWRLHLGVSSHSMSLALCGLLQKIGLNIETEIDLVDIGAQNKVSLEDLCRKGVDEAIKSGEFSSVALNHATTLCVNLDVSLRKKEIVQHLQETVHSLTEGLKRTQLLLTAHIWMFEEITSTQTAFVVIPLINRSSLLVQLRNSVKTLTAWRATLKKMRDEIGDFVTAITQRLKWAVGANPALLELLTSFQSVVNLKQVQFDKALELSEVVLKNCNSIIYYESLRVSTKEALEQDQIFLNLVSRWEKSCMMAQSCSTVVTPVEEALVELLDPEGPIDHLWLSNVSGLIDDMIDQAQFKIVDIEKQIVNSQDSLHNCAHRLRTLMGNHHRMAVDVRALLRSTLKVEGSHLTPIKEYLRRYKEFLDTLSELHGNVLSKDFTEEVVDGTLQDISKVLNDIDSIFNDLFLFENDFKEMPEQIEEKQENRTIMPSLRKNRKGTQTEQKRNAYAVSVWRRIRMKLEGRDPDPTRRSTVQEQVDWMIREAMNPDNLAVLYEGWTPWV